MRNMRNTMPDQHIVFQGTTAGVLKVTAAAWPRNERSTPHVTSHNGGQHSAATNSEGRGGDHERSAAACSGCNTNLPGARGRRDSSGLLRGRVARTSLV
jgi:hypothetical protein